MRDAGEIGEDRHGGKLTRSGRAHPGSYSVLAEAGKFKVGPLGGWLVYEGLFFALQWLVIGIAVALVYQRVASRG